MAVKEVNIRDFRNSLSGLLDQVDAGLTLIVSRRGDKKYTLLPLTEDDLEFTPEMQAKVNKAIEDIQNGEGTRVKGISGIRDYFSKL